MSAEEHAQLALALLIRAAEDLGAYAVQQLEELLQLGLAEALVARYEAEEGDLVDYRSS